MDRSINRFNTAEKQINELKDRSKENIQNTAERQQIKKSVTVARWKSYWKEIIYILTWNPWTG